MLSSKLCDLTGSISEPSNLQVYRQEWKATPYIIPLWDQFMSGASIELTLDVEIEARLRRLADARQIPARGLVHEAIEQYVEREEAREHLRQETLTAWSDYQSTGRYVTADEADAWLSKLEAGEDADPPAPHL